MLTSKGKIIIRRLCLILCIMIAAGQLVYWIRHPHLTKMQLFLELWWAWIPYFIFLGVASWLKG